MASEKKLSFKEMINSSTPTLLDFHATWCGPCHAFAPILDQLKTDLADGVRILKIDVDKNPAICQQLSVQSMPTVILFHKGEIKWRASGVQSLPVLKEQIAAIA